MPILPGKIQNPAGEAERVLCSGNDPATTLHFVRKLKHAAI